MSNHTFLWHVSSDQLWPKGVQKWMTLLKQYINDAFIRNIIEYPF